LRAPGASNLWRGETLAREDEFRAFVAARYGALVRTAFLLAGDRGHAEDLTQSALIRTYLAWGRLRAPENADAYARRALIRLAARSGRRRWNAEIPTQQVTEPASVSADDDIALDVQRALADQLMARGQRRLRRHRALTAVVAAVAVAAAAFGVPVLVHTTGGGRSGTPTTPRPGSGPTAAQLARFRWSALPASPLGPRFQPITVWTGHELLELGGVVKGSTSYQGAAFDPATGRWRQIAATGGNVGFSGAVTVWTGRQLFVSNGQYESCLTSGGIANCLPHAGLYDPMTNRWSLTPLPQPMDGLTLMGAVWTGRDVVLAGVNVSGNRLGVASYNPAANRWQMITPRLPAGHPAQDVTLVATPGRLILWSLWSRRSKGGFSGYAGVDVLALGRDGSWHDVTGNWPQNQTVTSPAFTGSAILISPGQIWCGSTCSHPYAYLKGYFADPATLARTTVPLGPLGQTNPPFVWTGRAIIAFNLDASISGPGGFRIRPDDMALWDPAASRWRTLPPPPGHPPISTIPLWTGTNLLALTDQGTLLSFHR